MVGAGGNEFVNRNACALGAKSGTALLLAMEPPPIGTDVSVLATSSGTYTPSAYL